MSSLETTAPGEFDAAFDDARIGRYVYRRLVGSGGMGIVVAAHDPELDREVAIKLVGASADAEDDRPLREAQAMAKLSHPNVVQVYEVIRLDARTAIVMQLVEGEDLGTWRRREDRGWREIVDAYVQAARGLAAAHRAGIVHRDFKPSNVLVDREGIVRVTDFGIAQRATDKTSVAEGLAGTPAYMAPEQHRGATVDARTDQWSFGCALYEALYGQRPYQADDRTTLAAAVIRGELPPDPTASPVPRRIRAAIRRALATDPDERFASVDDLVAVLAAPPRRVHYAITAGIVVAALVTVSAISSRSASAACQGLDAPIKAAWTDTVRAQLRARLLASDVGLPAATVDRALHGLDQYATSWTATRTGVCKDAQQGVRSADALDTRMRCLDHRLAEMSGLLDGLAEGSGATLRAASDAVAQLQPTTECSDAKDIDPRPTNPALRGEIDAAEAGLARATALVSLGRFETAAPLADRAATVGEHAGSPGLMARALIIRGECEDRLGHFATSIATLQRAATAAAKAHDNRAIVDALSHAFLVDGDHLGHRGDALRTRPFIELALENAGQPQAERAAWLHYLAILLYGDASKIDQAAADEREALAIRQRTLPPDHIYIIDSIETLANIEAGRGHFDEAKRMLEQVRDARVAARGPNDTTVSAVYSNLGALELQRGDLPAAVRYLEPAVEIGDKVGHPDTPALFNLGLSELDLGHLALADHAFSRTLEIYKRLLAPESLETSRDVGESLVFLGVVALAEGDDARGRPLLLHGVEVARRSDSPSLPTALSYAARLALHDGDRAKAHALLDEAMKLPSTNPVSRELTAVELARAETGCAATRKSLAKALADIIADGQGLLQSSATVELSECELEAGDRNGARTRLETELARLQKEGADDSVLAPVRAALARAR